MIKRISIISDFIHSSAPKDYRDQLEQKIRENTNNRRNQVEINYLESVNKADSSVFIERLNASDAVCIFLYDCEQTITLILNQIDYVIELKKRKPEVMVIVSVEQNCDESDLPSKLKEKLDKIERKFPEPRWRFMKYDLDEIVTKILKPSNNSKCRDIIEIAMKTFFFYSHHFVFVQSFSLDC